MDTDRTTTRPIDIRLPEGITLPTGAIFVTLNSLDKLEEFWLAHREELPYCVESTRRADAMVLGTHEWIFAPSKVAAVKTAMRWDDLAITCEWHEYPAEVFETDDQWDCCTKAGFETPNGGWSGWILKNEPDWLSEPIDIEEGNAGWAIISRETATELLLETVFNYSLLGYDSQGVTEWVEFHDPGSMEKNLAYWKGERSVGEWYYGCE